MRLSDTRKITIVGVFVAAVLAACLVVPAFGQVVSLEGTWLAAAILGVPTAAVLTATGYRHYGLGRGLSVAVLGGSATSLVMGAVLYGVPALVVLGLGLLALWLVPARSTTDRSFEHVDAG